MIIFDDTIDDKLSNKTLNLTVTELFIRGRKPKFSLVFIINSHFAVPKNIRLNSTHYFIMITWNKRELQQIASWVITKNVLRNHIILVIDDALESDNSLRFVIRIDDQIRYEKLQCDTNREAGKISTLSLKNW